MRGFGVLRAAVVAWCAATVVAVSVLVPVPPASAITGGGFNPGNIISDTNFYNGSAMTQPEIQSFLNSTVGACTNGKCLNVLRVNTTSKAASGNCGPYSGAVGEAVSTVIYKVQRACNISAKVILVTLQKETSLLTAKAPTDGVLRKAMGYACPDTSACDSAYYGIFDQLYGAAWQLAWYNDPDGSFTWHKIGQASNIAFHPDSACGSAPVVIQNRATAALYYYTPYQPNAAALANLYGTGDGCSAYGNRNFWVFYNQYFGPPTLGADPRGDVNEFTARSGAVFVRGWAFDPDTPDPIKVDVYVDGKWTATLIANAYRPDVATAYPGQSAYHGFAGTVPAAAGSRSVCVYGINVGSGTNRLIECATVTVPANGSPPIGDVNTMGVTAKRDGVAFTGWAIDPDTTSPINVEVTVDGVRKAVVLANQPRPDVGAAYPASGPNHGFSGTVAVPYGVHSVCISAPNVGGGTGTTMLECRKLGVFALGASPIGTLATATRNGLVADLVGWSMDTDTSAPILVDIWINGRFSKTLRADVPRADIGAAYPNYGPNHGFIGQVALSPGTNQICAYGINVGGGAHRLLGCRSVTMPAASPIGDVNEVKPGTGGVYVRGWALDPDTPASTLVDVWINDRWAATLRADQDRPDVAAAFPGAGSAHGFGATVPAAAGPKKVCVWALNVGGGAHTLLRCALLTR